MILSQRRDLFNLVGRSPVLQSVNVHNWIREPTSGSRYLRDLPLGQRGRRQHNFECLLLAAFIIPRTPGFPVLKLLPYPLIPPHHAPSHEGGPVTSVRKHL